MTTTFGTYAYLCQRFGCASRNYFLEIHRYPALDQLGAFDENQKTVGIKTPSDQVFAHPAQTYCAVSVCVDSRGMFARLQTGPDSL
jgi:hypothetical protein